MDPEETDELESWRLLIDRLVEYTDRNGYRNWLAEQETGLPCSDILCDYHDHKGCRHCGIAPVECHRACCAG